MTKNKQKKKTIKAIQNNQCQRCSASIKAWMQIRKVQYCWKCHQLGTVTELDDLVIDEHVVTNSHDDSILIWNGKLTEQQQVVADQLVRETKENQLVHAVTGAGKTEMLYPVIEESLRMQMRIAFVAPRIDVVNEISARMSTVFNIEQAVLTGERKDNIEEASIVFTTVHQLFKLRNMFHLIIVDECDAFPLYGDKWLMNGILNASKKEGRIIYLTATLPNELLNKYNVKNHNILRLYKRFHGHPLPNITVKQCGDWRKNMPKDLLKQVRETQIPIIIFVPEIMDCLTVQRVLQETVDVKVECVFAGCKNKIASIQRFKSGETKYLITTILLERGVTFPEVDVFILGAEEDVYTTSSIIQIAGRCGRSSSRPYGNVWVYTRWQMRKIKNAYREIKRMNG